MKRCLPASEAELDTERDGYKYYIKKRKINVTGAVLLATFASAVGFYGYVRVKFSLQFCGIYGIVVLAVEALGALAIFMTAVWGIALPNNSDIVDKPTDESVSFLGKELRRPYHVRVLVPCYKEPLSVVRRTVLAALRANRPSGCEVTVYLCDDGRKEDKMRFIKKYDDARYVAENYCYDYYGPGDITDSGDSDSRRLHEDDHYFERPGNGKSTNLNRCLNLIYGDCETIPLGELVVLLDADQTCSATFLETMLDYIDSGDNVAVALSPQIMFNVLPDCDIFNHQNVCFWECIQPGMDALNFMSLTGTNMVVRARALQQCGWFPVDTVTEDWELGLRMKALRTSWKCRYVQEYCVIGEAPTTLRATMRQRSRWCKGHFQTFWKWETCPLIQRTLDPFDRIMYSSTCVMYLSAALTTPFMTFIPIVTLLVGYFPVALNFWTVLGITVYYSAITLVTFGSASLKGLMARWLAHVSVVILFWQYLKASLLTPIRTCIGPPAAKFKPTNRGTSAGGALDDVAPSAIIVIASVVALAVTLRSFNLVSNAPKAIAIFWVVHNAVPHILMLMHTKIGQCKFMERFCKVSQVVSGAAAVAALVMMWLLYPVNVDFADAARKSLDFLDAQRSGTLPPGHVAWRFDTGAQNVFVINGTTIDLSGGFYNNGEVGPVKITSHVALVTSTLAWSLLEYPAFWRESGAINQAVSLVFHGVTYLESCILDAGALPDFVFMVGSIYEERQYWHRPEDLTTRQLMSTVAGSRRPADLMAQISAGMAAGSLALASWKAEEYPASAARVDVAHAIFQTAMYAPGPYQAVIANESYIEDYYPSQSYFDDLFWASTWLYRASLSGFRTYNETYYLEAMKLLMGVAYSERDDLAVTPDYLNNMAAIHAASISDGPAFHATAQSFIWDWMCSGMAVYSRRGRAWYKNSPLMGGTMMTAALAKLYSTTPQAAATGLAEWYSCFAESQGRYTLLYGYTNPAFTRTYHSGASCPIWPTACPISAATSPAPDVNALFGALAWAPTSHDGVYDVRGANDTVVSLENNWAMPLLWGGLAADAGPYTRCLQGVGALLKNPVCRTSRPISGRLGPTDVYTQTSAQFKPLWIPQPGTTG